LGGEFVKIEIGMFVRSTVVALCLVSSAFTVSAAAASNDPTPEEIQNIIKKFTQKETEFSAARENYTYRQTTKLTETDPPGGSFEVVEDVGFDSRNRRTSHVTYAPVQSLVNIVMTAEDEQDFKNVMPFVMTNDTADQYVVNYVGREKVDEISCFVFSVRPKVLTKDRKRYFEGQIWVDDQDYQIVKTYGRATGHLGRNEDQQFPKFETYREQIDGKYWFPTYTYADDVLNFKDGPSQRIKEVIKYDHYKRFGAASTITFGGVVNDQTTSTSTQDPKKPPKQ
jgi:outer membrane lipoprotein-sorting protein